jgi:hypothetical protein
LEDAQKERREFFRVPVGTALKYKAYADGQTHGTVRNISQSGVLFQTEDDPPKVSSLLWLSLDIRTLKICQEIEARALVFNNGILGKVVRVEEDLDGEQIYDVGVCFLRKDQRNSSEVEDLLRTL